MITTAFLIKVIIYGLIAAVIIPAIDFVMFLIRESRRTGYHTADGTTEWRPEAPPRSPRMTRNAPAPRQRHEHVPAEPPRSTDRVPTYVASNGVTITPSRAESAAPLRQKRPVIGPSSHPHAEYWSYGDVRFYEHA